MSQKVRHRGKKKKKNTPTAPRARARSRGLAMGRGRRTGPSSSDDSDDGASPAGGLSSQLGKGSKKHWKPGMSGREQKARAKEQRLEQERRKAERERRHEDKREKREHLEHESGEIHHQGVTPPKSASRRARQHDDGRSSSRDGGGAPHRHRHHHLHDAAQIRRDVRRLFGRIQHGGTVVSLDTGADVACGVGDVFVVVAEDAAAERRKSGADAWSARVQKGEETETPLAEFLRVSRTRSESQSSALEGESAWGAKSAETNAATASLRAEPGEPPYHRVRRVFARRRGEDDEPRVVVETLWELFSAHFSADDASGAATRRMASLKIAGLGGSPDAARSPRSASPAARSGGFRAGACLRAGRSVAASSVLPGHLWEEVFARCDPASVARLGATCAELAELARSSPVRQAQHAKLFGRAAPAGSAAAYVPRPSRAGAPPRSTPPAGGPAELAAAAARKGWAATCASFLAADPWLPRRRNSSTVEDEDEDDSVDDETEDGVAWASDGVAFDEDDDDFERRAHEATPRNPRDARIRSVAAESCSSRALARAISSDTGNTEIPRPRAKFRGVGPQSARHLLANDAAAVSCDGSKIKLWFHGGDGATESGKRIATLPNPAGAKAWTALAAGPGTFLAGDAAGRLTVWDADTLEVKHARCNAVAEWDGAAQTEVTRANEFALTSLAAIPNATLVACASCNTSVVRFLDVAPLAEAPQTPLVHSHARIDGPGAGFNNADDAATTRGVDAVAVSGGEVTYGAAGDRAFAPRGPGSCTPRLWTVARSAAREDDAHLVAVDLGTLEVDHRVRIPDAFFPDFYAAASFSVAPRSRFSVATHGDLVVAARDGVAAMWDARVASAARGTPVALFWDDAERGLGGVPVDAALETDAEAPLGGVAVDEWAVWVSRGGGDGVRLYDARRATGPPRGRSRWHDGDALRCSPVAVYGAGAAGEGKEGALCGRRVGAFARGGVGALVVAPAAKVEGQRVSGEATDSSGVRCAVYTSGHHGDAGGGDGEDADAESAAWEDGFAKPRGERKKKAAKKVRKKYPKRQGGKFRARTAGG